MAATTLATMLWFVIDWCLGSTFRSMSIWMLYVNNFLAAAILMLPFMLTRRVWVQVLWLALVDMLLMANLMYCRTYFTGIPPESYLLAGNLGDFTASVWDMLRWRDVVFLLILVGGAVAAARCHGPQPRRLWLRYLSVTALLAVISAVGMAAQGGFYRIYDGLTRSAYKSSCGVPVYTVAGHVAYHIMESRRALDPEVTALADAWLEEHPRLMPAAALPDSVAPRRNLVIILLESFETWPLEREIDGKPITPYLNSLLVDSSTFYAPRMLTQVGPGRSIDAQLLLTAGLLPMNGSVYSTQYPGSTYLTLPKVLKERWGAESSIFAVDKPFTWNYAVIEKSFGYDHIYDRSHWDIDETIGYYHNLSDGSFFRQSAEKLGQGGLWPVGEPAMLTFVSYSGHNPFVLPDELHDPAFDLSALGLNETARNYIEMAHYTDAQLPALVDYLRSRPDWPETLVLITGDHEGLAGDRKAIVEHSALEAELVDAGQYTPFILLNSPVPGRYEDVMGQVDMYPTLLGLMGAADYRWQGVGQSVFAPGKIPAAISTMTGTLAGDTTGVDPARLRHWQSAHRISDIIIRTDRLADR